jgi:D-aspartate ligase
VELAQREALRHPQQIRHLQHNETPVVILRLDHYGALGILRSLGRLGVPTYGLHRTTDAPALRSRYSRGGFVWDLDQAPAARSVEYLFGIAARLARRPILVPSNDETALFLAENAAQLRAAFRFQENSAQLVRALYGKRSMYELARRLGIPTAETFFPTSREQVRAFAATAQFPLMLKGSDGIRVARRTGRKMAIVSSVAELLDEYDRMEDPARPDLMIQEYIPGGEDAQWMFNGYFDARSECAFGLTGRKLRQTPVYTGMTSLGVCIRNDEIDRLTREFMKAIGYRGILDIGYRYDARDGRYKVLDVNPRVGATFRLFVGDDGMDVARAMYLDLTGQPVPRSRLCEGRKWFVEDLDFASSLRYHRDGVLGVGDWLHSFAGVRESAWFARDDLAPFFSMCRRFVAQAARKLVRAKPRREPAPLGHRERVTRHFAQAATYWKQIYDEEQLVPLMYRERHATALRWVDTISLPDAAQVLEVGCGAGHTAVALAQRGYRVHALDATPEMIALTRKAAESAGLPLTTRLAEVHDLPLAGSSFDLVLALGVLPWLDAETRGMAEMARVLKPGGYLIATADNQAGLHRLLDPRSSPALRPARLLAKRALQLVRAHEEPPFVDVKRHDAAEVDLLVRAAGLRKVESATVGFGPFSILGRPLLSEDAGIRLHRTLQRLAHQDWPILRSTGAHYLILARKPAA